MERTNALWDYLMGKARYELAVIKNLINIDWTKCHVLLGVDKWPKLDFACF